MKTSKVFVLVNPNSRGGLLGERWPLLEPELREVLGPTEIQIFLSTPQDEGEQAVRQAILDGYRQIVVLGGDGTVSEAIQGFFESHAHPDAEPLASEASLYVLPSGRGDDFFKSIGGSCFKRSSEAWKRGLQILRCGVTRAVDVGWVEFESGGSGRGSCSEQVSRFFINIASFGYPGLVVKRVFEIRSRLNQFWLRKSSWTYLVQSLLALKDYVPISVRVSLDGQCVWEGPLFSGFVLNGRYNGGGMCWSDTASLSDGNFNLLLFKNRGLLETLKTSPKMWTGKWEGVPGVYVAQGREVEVELLEPRALTHPFCEVDGELLEPTGTMRVRFQNLHAKVKVGVWK